MKYETRSDVGEIAIWTPPPSSLPSRMSVSARSVIPRICRYFLPRIDSRERQMSVSADGREKGEWEEVGLGRWEGVEMGTSNGLAMG